MYLANDEGKPSEYCLTISSRPYKKSSGQYLYYMQLVKCDDATSKFMYISKTNENKKEYANSLKLYDLNNNPYKMNNLEMCVHYGDYLSSFECKKTDKNNYHNLYWHLTNVN